MKLLPDLDAALAAHQRMPEGTQHNLLADDPETREEQRAELQRQRVRAWRQRRISEARALGIPIEKHIAGRTRG